ncbi:hypothetical protein [Janthinobacterium agaricidamnosum]|uniref:hypothetical protein n=1 Tax=Janthinobacterium agaricidamnosum TaxID=55508 RepID=UPI001186FC3E|nr:hypothetical protein [Janthinobacterium agaricidamnosum]
MQATINYKKTDHPPAARLPGTIPGWHYNLVTTQLAKYNLQNTYSRDKKRIEKHLIEQQFAKQHFTQQHFIAKD